MVADFLITVSARGSCTYAYAYVIMINEFEQSRTKFGFMIMIGVPAAAGISYRFKRSLHARGPGDETILIASSKRSQLVLRHEYAYAPFRICVRR